MDILTLILIIIGVWFIVFSFLLSAENIPSKIIFKVIPFFSGVYCVYYALIQSGILVIGK